MDKFLEVMGALGVIAVLLIMSVITANSGGGSATALVIAAMLPWAIPAIVGFVMIAAFGSMLGHLKAIRESLERQEIKTAVRAVREDLDDFRAR